MLLFPIVVLFLFFVNSLQQIFLKDIPFNAGDCLVCISSYRTTLYYNNYSLCRNSVCRNIVLILY